MASSSATTTFPTHEVFVACGKQSDVAKLGTVKIKDLWPDLDEGYEAYNRVYLTFNDNPEGEEQPASRATRATLITESSPEETTPIGQRAGRSIRSGSAGFVLILETIFNGLAPLTSRPLQTQAAKGLVLALSVCYCVCSQQ